ncbi:hypothetical protein [Paracnuella aquatica]|uniref:hypothetical protein n=1 Tax=Paracnuella aquatica TaxID=2268757 RepID=UPI000DEEED08|nr:hypothetical protein [Paracnuella aquatica]RPD51905.1 hypothetical protein DRJ53_04300 [Paracnuella aquatica]
MRILFFSLALAAFAVGCSNDDSSATATQTFCDTTCNTDTFRFEGTHKLKPVVTISPKNCTGDTLTWTHNGLEAGRQMHLGTMLENLVRLNNSAIDCYIHEDKYAWLSFNDCNTGRGYLMKLPFDKKDAVKNFKSAINSFDKKFVVPQDLRAYADYSNIYVVDIAKDTTERMTFKEEYKINWNDIHSTIDSVNISRNRIFVQLIKDGKPVQIEKAISL